MKKNLPHSRFGLFFRLPPSSFIFVFILVHRYPGNFHDFAPFNNFTMHIGAELRSRNADRLDAVAGQPLRDIGQAHQFVNFGIEFGDDLFGCSRRRQRSIPAACFIAGYRLCDSWQFGNRRRAL